MIQCKQCGNMLMAGQHTCDVCGVWNENQTVATPPRRTQHLANPHGQGVYRNTSYNAQNAPVNASNSSGYTFPTQGQNGAYRGTQTPNFSNNASPYFQRFEGQPVYNRQDVIRTGIEREDKNYKIQVGLIIAASVLFVIAGTYMWLKVYGFI